MEIVLLIIILKAWYVWNKTYEYCSFIVLCNIMLCVLFKGDLTKPHNGQKLPLGNRNVYLCTVHYHFIHKVYFYHLTMCQNESQPLVACIFVFLREKSLQYLNCTVKLQSNKEDSLHAILSVYCGSDISWYLLPIIFV